MGDRAMAEIKTKGGSLFVYTHWGGSKLPTDSKEAVLAAQPRWDDYDYATRNKRNKSVIGCHHEFMDQSEIKVRRI